VRRGRKGGRGKVRGEKGEGARVGEWSEGGVVGARRMVGENEGGKEG